MKKIFLFFLSFFLLTFSFQGISAQEINSILTNENYYEEVKSEIIAPQYAKLTEAINFKAEIYNVDLAEEYLEYIWDFGNDIFDRGKEISHVFTENGEYTVKLTIKDKEHNLISENSHQIKVGREFYFLINDNNSSLNEINYIVDNLRNKGNLVFTASYDRGVDFITKLSGQYPLTQIDSFILLSDDLDFYDSILSFVQEQEVQDLFLSKPIIVVNKHSFDLLRSVINNIKHLSQSNYIVLLKNYLVLGDLFSEGSDFLIDNLYQLDEEYEVVGLADDNLPWYRPMSKAVNEMLKNGISLQYIWLFLALSIIITIIVMARQLIGFYSVNLYIPTLLVMAFMLLGLKVAFSFFLIILFSIIIIRLIVKRVKILYMPSIALGMILLIFALFFLLSYLLGTGIYSVSAYSILPLLMILLSSEKFLSLHFKYTSKEAWFTILETLAILLAGYLLVSWPLLKFIVLTYPETILILIPLNIFLGRRKGLRLLEYRRFYQIMHKEAQEDFDELLIK